MSIDAGWAEGQAMERATRVPYYAQLQEILAEQIRQGTWPPGHLLPSEAELCARFGVSRTVVRQALSELVHEGLIVREQGKGSFVAQPKISEGLVQRLTGFYEDMAQRGFKPTSKVLRQEVVPASAALARYLEVEPRTELIAIDRLRYVRGEPLVLVTTCIPRRLFPGLVDVDLQHRSLYDVLRQQAGIVITRGRRWIEAVAATPRQASLLAVRKGAPLIRLESVSYLADGTPVEYYDAIHRSDRARFEVDLVRLDSGWPARKEEEQTSRASRLTWPTRPTGARRRSEPTPSTRGG